MRMKRMIGINVNDMKKIIEVGSRVMIRIGVHQAERATVTTIITTNRKRYYVILDSGETTSYFYRHLYLLND